MPHITKSKMLQRVAQALTTEAEDQCLLIFRDLNQSVAARIAAFKELLDLPQPTVMFPTYISSTSDIHYNILVSSVKEILQNKINSLGPIEAICKYGRSLLSRRDATNSWTVEITNDLVRKVYSILIEKYKRGEELPDLMSARFRPCDSAITLIPPDMCREYHLGFADTLQLLLCLAYFIPISTYDISREFELSDVVQEAFDLSIFETQNSNKYRIYRNEMLIRGYPLYFKHQSARSPADFALLVYEKYKDAGNSNEAIEIAMPEIWNIVKYRSSGIEPKDTTTAIINFLSRKSNEKYTKSAMGIIKNSSSNQIYAALKTIIEKVWPSVNLDILVLGFLLESRGFLSQTIRNSVALLFRGGDLEKGLPLLSGPLWKQSSRSYWSLSMLGVYASDFRDIEFTIKDIRSDPVLADLFWMSLFVYDMAQVRRNPKKMLVSKHIANIINDLKNLSEYKRTNLILQNITRQSKKIDSAALTVLALLPLLGINAFSNLLGQKIHKILKRAYALANPSQRKIMEKADPDFILSGVESIDVPSAIVPGRVKDLLTAISKLSGEIVPLHECKRIFNLGSQPKEIVELFDTARTSDGKYIIVKKLKENIRNLFAGTKTITPLFVDYSAHEEIVLTKNAIALHLNNPKALADKDFIHNLRLLLSSAHPGAVRNADRAPVIAWALVGYAKWNKHSLYISEMQSDNVKTMKDCVKQLGEKKGKEYFTNLKKYDLLDWPLNLMNLIIKYANRQGIGRIYMSTAERIVRRWHGQAPEYTTQLFYNKLPTMYGFKKTRTKKGVFWALDTSKYKEVLSKTKKKV